jgi:hypothetical protein
MRKPQAGDKLIWKIDGSRWLDYLILDISGDGVFKVKSLPRNGRPSEILEMAHLNFNLPYYRLEKGKSSLRKYLESV